MCVFLCNFQAADAPHMLSVPMTWVKEGGMVRLDKKYLRVDYKGFSSDDILYTIRASDGQPKYGTNSFYSCNYVATIQELETLILYCSEKFFLCRAAVGWQYFCQSFLYVLSFILPIIVNVLNLIFRLILKSEVNIIVYVLSGAKMNGSILESRNKIV